MKVTDVTSEKRCGLIETFVEFDFFDIAVHGPLMMMRFIDRIVKAECVLPAPFSKGRETDLENGTFDWAARRRLQREFLYFFLKL